ncbi:MAG: preprotein translocase subunit SecG [Bacteroidaceae bacterium]|nr:preprotein translocase subunit SecG [Bacteroidaceae bacterium]
MYSVLVILAVIAAILLILIVLVQESKGGGLTSNMAGGNSIMGVHKTTNFVENTTWTLAIALVVLSIATHFCTPEAKNADAIVTDIKTAVPAAPAPTVPALDVNAPAAPAEAPAAPVAPATEAQN